MNTPSASSSNISRLDGRKADELRPIRLTPGYNAYAEGSALIEYGDTKVLCTASLVDGVPDFLRHTGQGWLTAEYSMLPRATRTRTRREVTQGKATGRTQEIQRLIGRSLRTAFNLEALGPRTLHIDCDVLQADGGTRTASITGAFVAAYQALMTLSPNKQNTQTQSMAYSASCTEDASKAALWPLQNGLVRHWVAAISMGIVRSACLLDLNYEEDSQCDTDMNVVMTSEGTLIEIQGTAEQHPFSRTELFNMLDSAQIGIVQLVQHQKAALGIRE